MKIKKDKNLVMAYDLIMTEVDKDTKEEKIVSSKMFTLESIGIDYDKEIEAIDWHDHVDYYNALIYLMEDNKFGIKVAKVLRDKGWITKDNYNNVSLSIMVWDTRENVEGYLFVQQVNGKIYYELGYSTVDLYYEDLFGEQTKELG